MSKPVVINKQAVKLKPVSQELKAPLELSDADKGSINAKKFKLYGPLEDVENILNPQKKAKDLKQIGRDLERKRSFCLVTIQLELQHIKAEKKDKADYDENERLKNNLGVYLDVRKYIHRNEYDKEILKAKKSKTPLTPAKLEELELKRLKAEEADKKELAASEYGQYINLSKDLEQNQKEIEILEKKATHRNKRAAVAENILEQIIAEDTGYNFDKKLIKQFKKNKYQDLMNNCIEMVQKLSTDVQMRRRYLDEGYITTHIQEVLVVIRTYDICKSKEKNGWFFKNRDTRPEADKARDFLDYYRKHVNLVLNKYGLSTDNLTYNSAKLEEELTNARTTEWQEDKKSYQSFFKKSGEDKAQNKAPKAKGPQKIKAKDRIKKLEDVTFEKNGKKYIGYKRSYFTDMAAFNEKLNKANKPDKPEEVDCNKIGKLIIPDDAYVIRRRDADYEDMNDNKLHDDAGDYTINFAKSERELFEHEPSIRDIKQGQLGDCYFMAGIAAIVAKSPKTIKEMMKDNGDGTVTIRFFENIYDGENLQQGNAIYVTVDKTVPQKKYEGKENGTDIYSRGALWLQMLEKGYAALRRKVLVNSELEKHTLMHQNGLSYKNIEAGTLGDVMAVLTGKAVHKEMVGRYIFEERIDNVKLEKKFEEKHSILTQIYLGAKKCRNFKIYEKIESFLSDYIEATTGTLEVASMDNQAFVQRLDKIIKTDLKNFIKKQDELECKSNYGFHDCVSLATGKDFNKKKEYVAKIAIEMLTCLRNTIKQQTDNALRERSNEYTKKELEMLTTINDALDADKICNFGARNLSGCLDKNGKALEMTQPVNGIYGSHEYAILDTEKYVVGGKERWFLKVFNPHASNVPIYKLGEDGSLKRKRYTKGKKISEVTEEEKEYLDAAHGTFLLELRDARSFISELYISK